MMGTIIRIMLRKISGMALALSVVCAVPVFAGPPARPMVISGEILLDGMPVTEGTELKLLVAQTESVIATKLTEAGTSWYRVVLPPFDPSKPELQRPREGDPIKFISLGAESLATMTPLKWMSGPVLNNVLIKTTIQKTPTILSAAAAQDSSGKWLLKAKIRPVDSLGSGNEALSYRVKWLVRKTTTVAPDSPEAQAVNAAEEVLRSVSTEKESSLTYADVIKNGEVFELYVTPQSQDGKNGPSARQMVNPVLTKGDL